MLDGSVLPGLLGRADNFLVFAFLAALLIAFGIENRMLYIGLIVGLFCEWWYGYYFGSLLLSWLVMALCWHWTTRFLSIAPLADSSSVLIIPLLGVGYVLVMVESVVFVAVQKYLYGAGDWSILGVIALLPGVWISVGIALAVYAILSTITSNTRGQRI